MHMYIRSHHDHAIRRLRRIRIARVASVAAPSWRPRSEHEATGRSATSRAACGTSPDRTAILGDMVALRSARLEALLGSRLEHVQYPQLMTLISNQVAEALDLDFKPLSSPCLSLAL